MDDQPPPSKLFLSAAKGCEREVRRRAREVGGVIDDDEVLHAEVARRLRALRGREEAGEGAARASGQEPEWLT